MFTVEMLRQRSSVLPRWLWAARWSATMRGDLQWRLIQVRGGVWRAEFVLSVRVRTGLWCGICRSLVHLRSWYPLAAACGSRRSCVMFLLANPSGPHW